MINEQQLTNFHTFKNNLCFLSGRFVLGLLSSMLLIACTNFPPADLVAPTWSKGVATIFPGREIAHSALMEVDPSGNSYVVGRIDGPTDTDPNEFVLSKVDTNGQLSWSQSFLNTTEIPFAALYLESAIIPGLALDLLGNIYVLAPFLDSSDPNIPSVEAFLAKYDPQGNVVWEKSLNLSTNFVEIPLFMRIDENDQLYCVMYTMSLQDLQNVTSAIITAAYDKNGNLIWQQSIDNSSSAGVFGIDVIGDKGGIYVTYTQQSVDQNNNYLHTDVFVKYDPTGALVYSLSDQTVARALGPAPIRNSWLGVDLAGNAYIKKNTETGNLLQKRGTDGSLAWQYEINGHFAATLTRSGEVLVVSGGKIVGKLDQNGNIIAEQGFSRISLGMTKIFTDSLDRIYIESIAAECEDFFSCLSPGPEVSLDLIALDTDMTELATLRTKGFKSVQETEDTLSTQSAVGRYGFDAQGAVYAGNDAGVKKFTIDTIIAGSGL